MSESGSKKVTIIGAGRLGLSVALLFEENGFEVLAIDKNESYINSLSGRTFISTEPEVNEMLINAQNITFSERMEDVIAFNARNILIYVPTPENEVGYDHSILLNVLIELAKFGNRISGTNIVICSTVIPGFINNNRHILGQQEIKLIYSPEFIAQGSIVKNMKYPDVLLMGSDHAGAMVEVEELYAHIFKHQPKIHAMDALSAEITKLATNCFLTAKIAFANAIGDLATATGANPESVLTAIGSDSRIGSKYLGYGFGFGGPCFPRDNRALGYFAGSRGMTLDISIATDLANRKHTEFQVSQMLKNHEKDEVIFFDHVTYKPNSDILEESQQLKVAEQLAKKGRKVKITGSKNVIDTVKAEFGNLFIYD